MQEELLRNMARQKARQEFERERKRKIAEMRKLTEVISEDGIAMAETNDRLTHVHADLKNAFKMMRVSSYFKNKDGKLAVCSFTVFTTEARGEGGNPRKIGWGVCGLLPKTLSLFMTKICDIPYPVCDLTLKSKPRF